MDGTLAETEEVHRAAFNQAFGEAGLGWHWSEDAYRVLLGVTGGRERMAAYMAERGLAADPALVATLHVRKNAIYAARVADGAVEPRPGVVPLIEEAGRRGLALAIATTTSRANLTALLASLSAGRPPLRFAAMIVGEDVARKKPDPEAFARALAALALDPSECVAIEDSRNGLAAARAAGIATVVTPSRYTAHEDFAGAALIASSLEDVDVTRLEALVSPRR